MAALGDSALVVELGDAIDLETNARVHALDRLVGEARLAGIVETVPTYASVLVHLDPLLADVQAITQRLESIARGLFERADAVIAGAMASRLVELPVRYGGDDGPDLADVARRVGLTEDEVIRRHAAGEYRVAMLGFAPGFPYLMGLDPAIACPRLETPRVRVPAGSVAIAETQTGVYPHAMPGGWRLIGRTDAALFDPWRDPPAAVMPGDRVRFVASTAAVEGRPENATGAPSGSRPSGSPPALRIVEPGIQSTVQDLGRVGHQRLGVPPSGAADRVALVAANAAVGNDPSAAAIEVTAGGVKLEFLRPVTLALAGASLDARLDDRAVPFGVAVAALPGERLRLDRPTVGFRTYIALEGGVDVPEVLGSRSTYLPAGFGGHEGRALRAADELAAGEPIAATMVATDVTLGAVPSATSNPALGSGHLELPFVTSGQWDRINGSTRHAFLARTWTVSHRSDRMGLRLDGEALPGASVGRGFISDGTVTGAIQLPGDGLPIVLGVDRQTTGGYPKLGAVASAALHLIGQLQPGNEISFRAVSMEEARAALTAGSAG